MDATQPTQRRSAAGIRTITLVVLLLLCASAVVTACGGTSTTASSSPSATTTSPVASPSITPAAEPVSRWDVPGSASLAQTLTVAHRFAQALRAEKIPGAGFYTASSTFDSQPADVHVKGGAAIESQYREAAASFDWPERSHILAAPGVAVYEGQLKVSGTDSTPALDLVAVDGNKVAHEEVFLNDGTSGPVTYYGAAPGPKDTAKIAFAVSSDAFGIRDSALQPFVAPDILFRDASQAHGVRGWDALLAWWARVPTVTLANKVPIAGPGWAVVRWTIRQVSPTGVELAMPGATVMEVRGGKVVRMTLYYNSRTMNLQQ